MRKIVDFIQWLCLAAVNALLWPLEKAAEVLGNWMVEDEEDDDGDNWPFGGY